MILPIYLYGHPVLKKVAVPITEEYPEIAILMDNMYDTMYNAKGVGLAAPQIGLSIRLFVVDTIQAMKKKKKIKVLRGYLSILLFLMNPVMNGCLKKVA